MVALAIVLVSVTGAISLITRGVSTLSASRNKIIAANLAQEGIELVRLVRDNNIACDRVNGPPLYPWDADPGGGPMSGTKEVDIQQDFMPITCGDAAISFPQLTPSCSRTLLFSDAGPHAGTYGYQAGSPSPFSRCITISQPPASGDTPPIPASAQLDIVSTVTWTERGAPQTVELRERLYNWK